MSDEEREIWFKCSRCQRESYCGAEFDEIPQAIVMCPFCRHEMALADARLKLSKYKSN